MTEVKYPILAYAPGNYYNKCSTCGEKFTGDKLARQCEPCAINTLTEQIKELKELLRSANGLIEVGQGVSASVDMAINEWREQLNKH